MAYALQLQCPGGIIARRANNPWGPWSDATVVFQHDVDGGLCTFMHAGRPAGCGEHLNDPASPVSGESKPGGGYAPYVLPFLTIPNASSVSVFYLMSTWNPYQVVLMKTAFRR
jgi:hypothetical protein